MNMSDEVRAKIPQPVGFKIVIAVPRKDEKSEGGILLPEDLRKREQTASVLGCVVSLGPSAYQDETRFPTGPWCKPGDYIMFKTYAGLRFDVEGQEFRLINDDMVDAVVPDPAVITRL